MAARAAPVGGRAGGGEGGWAVGRRKRAPRRSCWRAAREDAGRRGEQAGAAWRAERGAEEFPGACLRIAAPRGTRISFSDWTQTGAQPSMGASPQRHSAGSRVPAGLRRGGVR